MTPYPLRFSPVLKQTIWGGRRLGEHLRKPIGSESNYAESWEVVDHGDDQSIVENGLLSGQTLRQVIQEHPSWLFGEKSDLKSFPLLLKYLDCNRVLSVQVHPSDQYALHMAKPDLGKTEAWYIVASEPESLIYAGLRMGVDQDMLQQAIVTGTTEDVLHSFHPAAGDIVFIPAGTVHALGAGLLVAEIQQSSDTTFRLFDWNRTDSSGNPRPLHLAQGIEVTDYSSGPVTALASDRGATGWQTIVSCDKFVLRLLENGEAAVGGEAKFHILTIPKGTATLRIEEEITSLSAGATVLLPAAMKRCTITAGENSTIMEMHLPA
ncbi:MAG: class I mannose-6-phosphate isomerase [Rubripirellula sp.]|nr:class I mannose-6-phosphate isomerase [Rubripirellula sp.]